MYNKNLTNYESWELDNLTLPKRSFLYSLKPIGLGTPTVEGLPSYLTRLASAHEITVETLIRHYIAPLFFLNEQPSHLSQNDAIKLAISQAHRSLEILQQPDAQFWLDRTKHVSKVVDIVKLVTSREDISYLTLLPWQTWRLSFKHIFHTEQRWCAACYQEWRDADSPIYQPLLWALEPVTVCPYHQRYLQLHCLCYGHAQPFLKLRKLNGYCHECGVWLGRFVDLPSYSLTKGHKFDWDLWVAQALGKLIAASPSINANPPIQETQVARYRTKPTLKRFLRWCYKLGVSPVEGLNLLEIMPAVKATT